MTTPITDADQAPPTPTETIMARRIPRQAYTSPASPLARRFGELVLYARKAKCLAQRDVAQAVGCSQPHIWHLEHGRVDPDLSLVAKLMEVLGIDSRLVFDGTRRRRRAA